MGGTLSCIDEQIPALPRADYDMSGIKSKPLVWMIGPPGSGRSTHAALISANLGFSNVRVAELLREEAKKDTERGKIVNDGLNNKLRKIPDVIVIDLIKEDMLRKASSAKGFLINNFPKTHKQGALFNKEIGEVDIIIYLICDTSVLVKRKQEKATERINEEKLRKAISAYIKSTREGIGRYTSKIEKISSEEDTNDVYMKIESAISLRIQSKTKIRAESDYAQSQVETEEVQI